MAQGGTGITSSFKKAEISEKTGQLIFNIVQVNNRSDQAIRIKPNFVLPDDWAQFNPLLADTLIPANDSIFLSLRVRIPAEATAEKSYELYFRAYGMNNELLSESAYTVRPLEVHDWSVSAEKDRLFFSPADRMSEIKLVISNQGNVHENITLYLKPDKNIDLPDRTGWEEGKILSIPPFKDTAIQVQVTYNDVNDRIFDMSRVGVEAVSPLETKRKFVMIEKYSDLYSPLSIDRNLPHLVEAGLRTFSNNTQVLPFIKARGIAKFKKQSSFIYNFNYYAQAQNEDLLSNTYYNFLYQWRDLKVGLGAFSSHLGRNLYTRNGLMVSNVVRLAPAFSLEAFISQSFIDNKTSAAVGYYFDTRKVDFSGSVAYDRDLERGLNTTSILFRTESIKFARDQQVSVSLYGFDESYYKTAEYSLTGVAYDLNYFGKFGKKFALQVINNYGSPDIPGSQMGLFLTTVNASYSLESRVRYVSMKYIYGTRNYYNIGYNGLKLPNNKLNDQYINMMYHSGRNVNHTWEAGPSLEVYRSIRPAHVEGLFQEYNARKFRLEYKGRLLRGISLDMKAGISDVSVKESKTVSERRYDFHLLGGYNFLGNYSVSLSYDYGPMVNNGLYQYPGDALNHSLTVGPSMNSTYFGGRVNLAVFTNFLYRFDLEHGAFNLNPKLETYLARDWYFVVSGTYHYSQQKYQKRTVEKSYAYAEFSVKKLWGKSDFNKWQKDTRKLKIIYFKDDNSNGVRDYGEEGVPYVKTRLKLTNSATPNVSTEFPVDIVLLSNEDGVVTFNKLPVGFYELTVMPLGDVKEYFYVDRGAEKLELTKVSFVYIPFQKATRLTGRIYVKRSQFIKQGDEVLSLENIRITAYNKTGNSYSSFSLKDGTFTIFVPGESEYYVRMPNVYGDKFKILKNDILVYVSDTTASSVVFNVVESSRQISFKKAKTEEPDSTAQPIKIKVLHGKLYENQPQDTVDVNALPEFRMELAAPDEQIMQKGQYYIMVAGPVEKDEAQGYQKILLENGIKAILGLDEPTAKYYVFTGVYTTQGEAKKEAGRLKKIGLSSARVLEY